MTGREALLAMYAELGLNAIPLRPRSKRPLQKDWQTPKPDAWAGAPPDANVGLLTGAASQGLVVLDFDDLELFHEILGLSPRSLAAHTIVVRSARGYHAYARHDGTRTRVPREGFSILGEGSLAVAPPSVHPSGPTYSFVGQPRTIAPLEAFAPDLVDVEAVHRRSSAAPAHELAIVPAEPLPRGEVSTILNAQGPKVREAWRLLTTPLPPDVSFDGSGSDPWSRADFLVALCLVQHGYEPARVAALLTSLAGSKAAARGMRYAARTCERAAETARTGRLPGRHG